MKPTITLLLFLMGFSLFPAVGLAGKPPQKGREITIAGTGDIYLGGSALDVLSERGFDSAFRNTAGIIRSADVATGNLESPVTSRGVPHPDKQYIFRMDRTALQAVAGAGFDSVSLANNHIMDYGESGLSDTFQALNELNIAYSGAGANLAEARAPAIVRARGVTVGFLSYSLTFPKEFWAEEQKSGTVFGHEKYVRGDVTGLAQKVDIVVVAFHWGVEKRKYPKPYQKMLAHAAVDSGAAIVFGHHPHVLQGVEWYKRGIIFYSLGNFAFGSYSETAKTGTIALVDISGYGAIKQATLVPLDVFNPRVLFRPTPLTGNAAREVLDELQEISLEFNTHFQMKGDLIQVLKPKKLHPLPEFVKNKD